MVNSGVTGGGGGRAGAECPQTSDWEVSADLPGKKRQGKRGKGVKIENKRRGIVKENVENLKIENGRWKSYKLRKGPFFFFFFFLSFFCFSLFKTKICFVLCLPKWKFSTRKMEGRKVTN